MRLMHCPFCKEDVSLSLLARDHGATQHRVYTRSVKCSTCDARGPETTSSNLTTAVETAQADWNNRVPHDEDLAMRIAFAMK